MSLVLGDFENCRTFFVPANQRPQVLGVSFGATSGMMAALSCRSSLLSFQNTGKEDARTYEFGVELADALGRDITWLEYRPPKRRGGRPREASFAVVTPTTADRSGGPFAEMLAALASYRATKGLGPIAPWARSRICTAYLKNRTQAHWLASLGVNQRDEWSGLRRDEPDRVEKWKATSTRAVGHHAPLFDAGITVEHVAEFWSMQSFQLNLPPHRGNCTGCFLKDQSDLSRALDEVGDVAYWHGLATKYPSFGGRKFHGYQQLASEAPLRRSIEAALRADKKPANDGTMMPRRFQLVVIQERKRIAGEVPSFSCNCEGAEILSDMDEEQEEQFVLSLPSEEAA